MMAYAPHFSPRHLPPDFIPPLELGEMSVEFERLKTHRHPRNDGPLSGANTATKKVLNIDNIGVVFVPGDEIDTVYIIPQDTLPKPDNANHFKESPRFKFEVPVLTLLNLTQGIPRIGVVLVDGTVHLLVRMRKMPWIDGDSVKPDFPKFVADTLSVCYSPDHNSLFWLFQRCDPRSSANHRPKSRLPYELWVYHFNWPTYILEKFKRRPDYILAQGLPGPGSLLPFSDHLLLICHSGVISIPYEELQLLTMPPVEPQKAKTAPLVELWQPFDLRVESVPLNQLQLRASYGRALRAVFHDAKNQCGMAIFGDVLLRFRPAGIDGMTCEQVLSFTQVRIPFLSSGAPLTFIYDAEDEETMILHDGTHMCVLHRTLDRRRKPHFDSYFREFPGVFLPSDRSSSALFRPMVGQPVFVRVVKYYMVKIPPYL